MTTPSNFIFLILNSVSCLLFRYKVGQHFGRHIDESVDLGEGKRTHYTLLIYLSGGSKQKTKGVQSNVGDSSSEPLVGGETVFYGSRNGIVAEVNPLSFLPTSLAIILHFVIVFFLSFFFDNIFFDLICLTLEVSFCWYTSSLKPMVCTLQVAPTEGMALLHIHGDMCMLHEARNVTKGIKYVFRSDVAFAWWAHDIFKWKRSGKFSTPSLSPDLYFGISWY